MRVAAAAASTNQVMENLDDAGVGFVPRTVDR